MQEDVWDPNARFSLSVREITSVSATFILSADPGLSDFSWDEDDEDADDTGVGRDDDHSAEGTTNSTRVIPDALAKGLSVLVNGQPWQRVLMRVDDTADEAIIIIYGLMPGRRYDIELGVAPGDEAIRGQVTTEHNTQLDLPTVDGDSSPEEDESTLAGSADSSPLAAANPLPLPPTIEEQALQCQQTLAQLSEERNTLAASLKATRRDAQKADAALRADIEGLKRASEKQAAGEHRARQKILALQEAVKQTNANTTAMEEETADIERSLPDLKAALAKREKAHESAKADAAKCRTERERAEANARRRTDASRSEITTLANRLDRLTTRKEKLETGTIADLEEQLRAVREEITRIESDPFSYIDQLPEEEITTDEPEDVADHGVPNAPGPHSLQARPGQPPNRMFALAPGPIQRPLQGPPTRLGVTQTPTSSPGRPKPAINPRRPPQFGASQPMSPKPNVQLGSASMHSSPSNNSTLSSRAPAFEPRRHASGTALNPASSAFEPKSILVNPNRARAGAHKGPRPS